MKTELKAFQNGLAYVLHSYEAKRRRGEREGYFDFSDIVLPSDPVLQINVGYEEATRYYYYLGDKDVEFGPDGVDPIFSVSFYLSDRNEITCKMKKLRTLQNSHSDLLAWGRVIAQPLFFYYNTGSSNANIYVTCTYELRNANKDYESFLFEWILYHHDGNVFFNDYFGSLTFLRSGTRSTGGDISFSGQYNPYLTYDDGISGYKATGYHGWYAPGYADALYWIESPFTSGLTYWLTNFDDWRWDEQDALFPVGCEIVYKMKISRESPV